MKRSTGWLKSRPGPECTVTGQLVTGQLVPGKLVPGEMALDEGSLGRVHSAGRDGDL